MGHKKRSVATRSKQVETNPSSLDIEHRNVNLLSSESNKLELAKFESSLVIGNENSVDYGVIKLECEKALNTLRRGGHMKAVRVMKELCGKSENSVSSGLVYRVQGTVFVKVASIIDDMSKKRKFVRSAIESAKKAVELCPESVEFAHFYANLLYEAASDAMEYEEVVRECERALMIENPVDPAKESLQEESQLKVSTADVRIGNVQNELRALIQKSNFGSISTWMKTLGNGDEKFRFIPIRRAVEDPMEVGLGQARRPNEIKKATKTPEERRKEIEVRVAAARLLQQKSESPQTQDDSNKGLDQSSGPGQRTGERKKGGNGKKNSSFSERKDFVQSYWNSMTLEMKIDLLKISMSDIKAHCSLLKDARASEVLLEAISFAEARKRWKFWVCCSCSEKFSDSESHLNHVVQEHVGKMSSEMKSVFPRSVNDEWAHMFLNCPWKPLDVSAAVEMIQKQSNSTAASFVYDLYQRNVIDEGKDCFAHNDNSDSGRDSFPQDKEMSHGFETGGYDGVSDSVRKECNKNPSCIPISFPGNWPLSDDVECAKLLEKISSVSLRFHISLVRKCHLSRYPEKNSTLDDASSIIQAEITEKLVLDELNSFLLLDKHFMPCKVFPGISLDAVTDDATSSVSASVAHENGVPFDADSLLSWIYAGSRSGDHLSQWTHMKEQKSNQGMEILQNLEKDFQHLQSLCERKIEHLSYDDALQTIEDICIEEGKRRDLVTEYVPQGFESVLRKWQEDLIKSDNEVMSKGNRFELDAISNVFKEAESLNVNQFGYEETYVGMGMNLSDLESGEEDNWRSRNFLHQADSYIEVAIQRQKEHLSIELNKIDARLLRCVTEMQHLEAKLEPTSAHDYRSILLPLLKSFIRAHLEDLAEKYATEKSDAAREAFLAELALDSKKGIVKGNDSSRNAHDKSKDKKRSKDLRKTKDVKVITNNELHMHPRETAESISSAAFGYDEDYFETEPVVAGGGVDLRDKEEELQLRELELEAEERKLEETLEYQRRVESEAKEKLLAEQHKRSAMTTIEKNAAVDIPDDYFRNKDNDKHVPEALHNFQQEHIRQSNGFGNNIGNVPEKNGDEEAQRIGITHSNKIDDKIKPSLSNGVIGDNGSVVFDRRTGRRGKHQKNSNKVVDRNYQHLPSQEIGKAGKLILNDTQDDAGLVNGTKTLRQLRSEEDEEERFQADLKRAVRQSLDAFHGKKNSSSPRMQQEKFLGMDGVGVVPNGISIDSVNGIGAYGRGLKNEVGEYNCFLNVIIQSLWHIRRFRADFLRRSTTGHVHVGDPCVICALCDIFNALSMGSTDLKREAVAPTSLRIALSNLYPESNFFQEAQMNDASEVLGVIFDCLHRSFTSGFGVSDTESVESNGTGSWDCANHACVAHSLFGMNIFERMNCYNCGLESREMKYTSFFHNINANALRTMKVMCPESSFDELINLVERNDRFMCDPEVRGCGKLNYKHHILSTRPHVFTAVLGWQNTCESVDDIRSTLEALATDIDIGVLYRGLDPENRHRLISVVCYYGQHYHCFAYSHDHERWIMYDDKTVKLIGGWDDVITMCEKGHLQPQIVRAAHEGRSAKRFLSMEVLPLSWVP
ncbi:Inactive ubiquitin carboxyl-terminal hydrolase 54 [Heracleum sosnowskyi]|uniref:Inactive ubiquitin carboxyl-terminal hydrolase 54 n=1 Tax=Heracleum sosnowskyi TaxID=360622 RepID=A0AAD8HV09_9APIA|nr:Inactive ubiquitin carboxyl-terminal hydrolase 54 [Heracleum sosnowskyi]